jgi:hypothetical protein
MGSPDLSEYDSNVLINELLDRYAALVIFGERKTNNPKERYICAAEGPLQKVLSLIVNGSDYATEIIKELNNDDEDDTD